MPSDDLIKRALEALEDRRESYHSAVATAVDEVRALLDAHRAPSNGKKGERAAAELGAFAAGRIDTERFESLFAEQETLDKDSIAQIEDALEVLTGILKAGDDLHVTKLRSGGDLRDAVRDALADAGRAFGAGRAVENARSGVAHAAYADGFSPTLWNRAERTVAPPLVVELDGADLQPAGLADYLEGAQALVLLVRKPAPPAALARLITPGTLVAQDTSGDAFDALRSWGGPAVVAVLPDGAAVFRYVPADDGAGELTVETRPEEKAKPVGRLSAARQEGDLKLLDLLDGAVAGRVVASAATEAAKATDPTDKLAAWLLRQATIPEPGEV
jgi:hypothetical protein